MSSRVSRFLLLFTCVFAGCANITTPTGGKKDIIPPRLVSISPADSLLNTRVKRIDMAFDEYVTVADVSKEVTISPILSIQPAVTGTNKHVTVKIVDSLLEENTTYRLSFGNAIKDIHEGNAFGKYTYTFSTGTYFDSLELHGTVISAATGLPDTGNIRVVLYPASAKDSAVVRQKPKYATKIDAQGNFLFKGLPKRSFRIYALKDANDNLTYDGGAAGELIAFTENNVIPGDTSVAPVALRLFAEPVDTAMKKTDTVATTTKGKGLGRGKSREGANAGGAWSVTIDTADNNKRTFDLTKPLINVNFKAAPTLNKDKITLAYDDNGTARQVKVTITLDTLHVMHIKPDTLLENTLYTLRLAKGFAKDTAGSDLTPARFVFRTMEDEDYGKIQVHLGQKYYGAPHGKDIRYVLQVTSSEDTVYQKPVTDTIINLIHLKPAKYTFRIIADKNSNGKWDSGDLFAKLQPETVIPYNGGVLTLKAGWENIVDFEEKPVPKKGLTKDKTQK